MSTAGRLRQLVGSNPAVIRSRPALADATAKLSDRLRGAGVVPRPTVTGPLPADEYTLVVSEWTIFHSRLFARFEVTPTAGASRPTRVLLTRADATMPLADGALTGAPVEVALPDPDDHELGLIVELADGRVLSVADPAEAGLTADPGGKLFGRFAAELGARPTGRALELGSRARSGNVYRSTLVPAEWEYVGLDIKEGPNVDVVGDAHDLVDAVGRDGFDAVFSIATFEHLAMPWKAVLAVNQVLIEGGLVYLGSHQAFPLHETPWDFWRFSDQAWRALFNKATGFEIVEVAMGEPANVVPTMAKNALLGVDRQPAFLTSSVLARKIGPATLEWSVPTDQVVTEIYPH